MASESPGTFRITPWRPWLLATTLLALAAALGLVVSAVTGHLNIGLTILLALVGAVVILLPLISLAVRTSRWHVDPGGVGGRNNWHVYHRLAWSEIESVDPWSIPGYRYLQVNGVRKRWAFWLPLFFTDMAGFRSAVVRHAPPENPLRQYLERHPA